MSTPGSKLKYTHIGIGSMPPLTIMACTPDWDDYFDLNESLPEMAQCLIYDDEQQTDSTQKDDNIKIVVIPPDDDTVLVPAHRDPALLTTQST